MPTTTVYFKKTYLKLALNTYKNLALKENVITTEIKTVLLKLLKYFRLGKHNNNTGLFIYPVVCYPSNSSKCTVLPWTGFLVLLNL